LNTLDKILSLLTEKGIQQKTFAENIGVTKHTITDWKNGRSKSYMKYIDKIADFFDVSADYLLEKTDDKSPLPKEAINIFDNVDMNAFSRQLYEQLTKEERKKVQEYILFLISQRAKNEKNDK
jgi:transcriptional regulator with XRE-family HTH domain